MAAPDEGRRQFRSLSPRRCCSSSARSQAAARQSGGTSSCSPANRRPRQTL